MRRSPPRLARARLAVRSVLRRKSFKHDAGEEQPTIYTRLPRLDEETHALPSRLLEARLHANVDVLSRKPLKMWASKNARPAGRTVPAGTAQSVPNAYHVFGRQSRNLGPVDISSPSNRPKPSFRRSSEAGPDLYESYLQSAKQGSSSQRLVGESNRLLRPAFRRAYSSMASPVATSSKVRIEDMEDMDIAHYTAAENKLRPPLSTFNQETPRRSQQHGLQSEVQSDRPMPEAFERASLERPSKDNGLQGVRMLEPESKAHMTGILRQAVRMLHSPKMSTLESLYIWHNRYPEMRSTGSYNILLQLAYDMRHLKAFNQILLQDMPAAGVERDSVTYDLEMESFARHGQWKRVVDSWTARREKGIPFNAIGWTRLTQAVTKRGTTSLGRDNIGTSMSPIYSALYDLPKGVRQLQLHKLTMSQRMDVDQMLALMMPDDLQPMDFHATLVIAHRLSKQMRWREAEDVVALYLDRSAETWDSQGLDDLKPSNTGGRSSTENLRDSQREAKALRAAGQRKQTALSLLHVLLECLVISRSSPEMIQAYIDNFLIRYENTGVKPKYHTLFFVLSAYRVRPLSNQFQEAYEKFISLESTYRPATGRLTDQYGLSRCLRQLQGFGYTTLLQLKKGDTPQDVLRKCEFDLENINSRLAEIGSLNRKPALPRQRRGQAIVARQPARHILLKERYKALRPQFKNSVEVDHQ